MREPPFDPSPDAQRARLHAWKEVLETCSYYQILGLDELAEPSAIRAAYHRFARAFHPDSHLGADTDSVATARRVFQRGSEAYRVLSHPELRIRYDMLLARGGLRLLSSNIPPPTQPEQAARPLHELCRSAGAMLCARKAAQLIDAGDPRAAKHELSLALEHDGGVNPAIQERIDALDLMLYAMGEDE